MSEVATLLAGSGIHAEERHSPVEQTLLELLRHGRREEAMSRVNTNKDEINVVDDGSTPLLVATTRGWGDVVEALVKSGANVNATSELGETPLMRAIKCGKIPPSTIKLILDSGGVETLNAAAKENAFFAKWTALHFACDPEMNRDPVVIALLASYGANTKAANSNGKLPSDMCPREHEFLKALNKPKDYLKHHSVSHRMIADEEERKSAGETVELGSETTGHEEESHRSSLLSNALHIFKPKKSSLLQQKSEPLI